MESFGTFGNNGHNKLLILQLYTWTASSIADTFLFTRGGLAALSKVIHPADIALLKPTFPAAPGKSLKKSIGVSQKYLQQWKDQVAACLLLQPTPKRLLRDCHAQPFPSLLRSPPIWCQRFILHSQVNNPHLFSLLSSAKTICWGSARRLFTAPTTFWCSQPHLGKYYFHYKE